MRPSIKFNLLKWLIAPLLAVNLIGAGLTYWLAWLPAQDAFDQSISDAAWALTSQVKRVSGKTSLELTKQAEQMLRSDHFDTMYFVVRDASGATLAGDHTFPDVNRATDHNEPVTYDGVMNGEQVRIAALAVNIEGSSTYIGIAETFRKRNQTHYVILISLLLLDGALTFFSIAIVLIAVNKGLHPLRELQQNLGQRNHDNLTPIEFKETTEELTPVVTAINSLLGNISKGATAQQNFLANVAHQIRTPLTGLRLQLEWLQQRHAAEPETAHSAELMTSSVERMVRQSNQLLALARAEPSRFKPTHHEDLSLDKLVEESVQHFIEQADKKQIDLGFDLQPARVQGDRFMLRDLIDNLVDNAVRYSPPQSTVTVSCREHEDATLLTVEDSGPGIAPEHRELIFDRFYRANDKISGSGLGLAIVRDIAKDHGGEISLVSGDANCGTVFTVRFPRRA
jgi:two-component system sensor histidine kinase TctE